MQLNTGLGYYVDSKGRKSHKFNLPAGTHPDPEGYTVVEVNTIEELNDIVLDKSDAAIAMEEKHAMTQKHRDSGKSKLSALGLTEEEIKALTGA